MDYFCILNKGGVVLFSKTWKALHGSPHPVDDLISSVILEGRLSMQSFTSGSYTMRWLLDNVHQLIYVTAENKFLGLPANYAMDMLNTASSLFQNKFRQELASNNTFCELSPKHVQEIFAPDFDHLCTVLDNNTDFSPAASISPVSPTMSEGPKPAKSPQGFKKKKGAAAATKAPAKKMTIVEPKGIEKKKKQTTQKSEKKVESFRKSLAALFQPHPKDWTIGVSVPPKRDLSHFVAWPHYVRIARQKRILLNCLKKKKNCPLSVCYADKQKKKG